MTISKPINYLTEIQSIINNSKGIKAVDLIIQLMGKMDPTHFSVKKLDDALHTLIHNDEIVVVKYTLTTARYSEKKMYFPKGTVIG